MLCFAITSLSLSPPLALLHLSPAHHRNHSISASPFKKLSYGPDYADACFIRQTISSPSEEPEAGNRRGWIIITGGWQPFESVRGSPRITWICTPPPHPPLHTHTYTTPQRDRDGSRVVWGATKASSPLLLFTFPPISPQSKHKANSSRHYFFAAWCLCVTTSE